MIIPVTIRPPGKIQALDSKSSVTSEDILSHWRSTVLLATEFSNSHIFKFDFNPLIFFFASGSQKISAHWMSNLGMKYWPLTQPLCRKTEMTTPDSITFCGQADVISLFFFLFSANKNCEFWENLIVTAGLRASDSIICTCTGIMRTLARSNLDPSLDGDVMNPLFPEVA